MDRPEPSPLELLRQAAVRGATTQDGTLGEANREQPPSPELPQAVANAREQRLLMAYRALAAGEVATEIVELLDVLASSRLAD